MMRCQNERGAHHGCDEANPELRGELISLELERRRRGLHLGGRLFSSTLRSGGEPARLRSRSEQLDSHLAKTAHHGRASDRREPLSGDRVEVDPPADVLRGKPHVGGQLGWSPLRDDRPEPHGRPSTRKVAGRKHVFNRKRCQRKP